MDKLQLDDSVTKIPLIGPQAAKKLQKLEIKTVENLLYHFPSRYTDYGRVTSIVSLTSNKSATIKAEVVSIDNIYTKYGKRLTKAIVKDNTGQVILWWFNQHYLKQNIKVGEWYYFSGSLGNFSGKPAIVAPEYEKFNEENGGIHTGGLVPVYPETGGISSKWLRSRIATGLKLSNIDEFLPEELLQKENLEELAPALNSIHFPKDNEKKDYKQAVRRLAFEELFINSLKGAYKKNLWQEEKKAAKINGDAVLMNRLISTLKFELTHDQQKVIKEILLDMEKSVAMNRLLQGDVGCGKTVVAAAAALAAAENGYNTAFMAPTQILAQQHESEIKRLLKPFGITVTLVKGGSSKKEKRQLNNLSNLGTSNQDTKSTEKGTIFIGTHALLFKKNMPNLALLIIDEQHRFGVKQRAKLSENQKTALGNNADSFYPHTLTMTATPIPRSLALTLYGNLDLSTIEQMPKGRKPVKTWLVPETKRLSAISWIQKTILDTKGQAFWVCPFIEESVVETLQSVRAAAKEVDLLKRSFPKLNLGLLHGRLKTEEKDKIIEDFKNKKIDLLVTTPVVEVGVDIPNTSIIVIEGSERFGLASLHQLRGRVGRGGQEAYCLLFTSREEFEKSSRLKAMETIHSGIKLAQLDLKIRGSGEAYGTAQHGRIELKIANLSDTAFLEKAQKHAKEVAREIMKYPKLYEKIKEVEEVAGN